MFHNFSTLPPNFTIGEEIDCYGNESRRSRVFDLKISKQTKAYYCIKIMEDNYTNRKTLLLEAYNAEKIKGIKSTVSSYGIYQIGPNYIGHIMQKGFLSGITFMQRCNYNIDFYDDCYRKDSAHIFYQVLIFLHELHKRGLLYLDLKMGNIVLTHTTPDFVYVSVIDYESIIRQSDHACEYITTDCYCSPEHCKKLPATTKDDVWSFGMLLMIFYTGVNPFSENNDSYKYATQITSNEYRIKKSQAFRGLPLSLKNLIFSCLQQDPEKRPTVSELLNHRFFSEQNITRRYIKRKYQHTIKYNLLLKKNN